jgi:hypothetical protein
LLVHAVTATSSSAIVSALRPLVIATTPIHDDAECCPRQPVVPILFTLCCDVCTSRSHSGICDSDEGDVWGDHQVRIALVLNGGRASSTRTGPPITPTRSPVLSARKCEADDDGLRHTQDLPVWALPGGMRPVPAESIAPSDRIVHGASTVANGAIHATKWPASAVVIPKADRLTYGRVIGPKRPYPVHIPVGAFS